MTPTMPAPWPASAAQPQVVVVGAGLAGLAAATGLVDAGFAVTLLEGRRRAGGRAASFEDPVAGGLVDACQHVAMGCCTNFLDLCGRAGLSAALRRDRTLWFIGPDGRRSRCTPSRWLPAPLHLTPLLAGMRHFSLSERAALALGMLRIARLPAAAPTSADNGAATAAGWLRAAGQPPRVIDLFWQPLIESALGESIELVSVAAVRKVVVDGFLAHRDAADLLVPTEPLGRLFGERLVAWLSDRGVVVRSGVTATGLMRDASGRVAAVACGDERLPCDAVVLAVPWKAAGRLVPDVVPPGDDRLAGSPITAVHLWFDREFVDLPHAVLVGRTSQWVFRGMEPTGKAAGGYCQVVISASRGLLGGDREKLVAEVVRELCEVFPDARDARLVDARVVTDPTAVLSVRPGVDAMRPAAVTQIPNLFLAGDWTATGWPSTMEGAIRSGRIAADAVAVAWARPGRSLVADLPRSLLTRLISRV